jgi:hypothetical protein
MLAEIFSAILQAIGEKELNSTLGSFWVLPFRPPAPISTLDKLISPVRDFERPVS